MTLRGNTLLVALLAGSLIGVVACGDDDDATTTTTTTTTSTTSTGGGGGDGGNGTGGEGTGGDQGPDCMQACADLFNCGLEDDGMGMQLCPGFTDGGAGGGGGASGITIDDFAPGCEMACADLPALANLIDPNNCPMTIATISGADMNFAGACSGMAP